MRWSEQFSQSQWDPPKLYTMHTLSSFPTIVLGHHSSAFGSLLIITPSFLSPLQAGLLLTEYYTVQYSALQLTWLTWQNHIKAQLFRCGVLVLVWTEAALQSSRTVAPAHAGLRDFCELGVIQYKFADNKINMTFSSILRWKTSKGSWPGHYLILLVSRGRTDLNETIWTTAVMFLWRYT